MDNLQIKTDQHIKVRPRSIALLKVQMNILLPGSVVVVGPNDQVFIQTNRRLTGGVELTRVGDDGGPDDSDLNPEIFGALGLQGWASFNGPVTNVVEPEDTASVSVARLYGAGIISEEEYKDALLKQDILLPDEIPNPDEEQLN